MAETHELPLPVARAALALHTAAEPGARALAAFDLAHAVTKYVALVRLAAWWRSGPSTGAEHGLLASRLDHLLWALNGAGPEAWWRLALLLESSTAELPATPGWSRVKRLDQLNTARRSRHAGAVLGAARPLPGCLGATVDALLEGAAPLLALPLVVEAPPQTATLRGVGAPSAAGPVAIVGATGAIPLSPLMVISDLDGALDLYVFERDTTTAPIYENHAALAVLPDGRDLLGALHEWARAVKQVGLGHRLGAAGHDELIAKLAAAAAHAAGRDLLPSDVEIERPALVDTLDRLAPEGVSVQFLVGASGVGKSHALRRLIAASTRAVLWVRAVHWNQEPLAQLLGEAADGTRGVVLPVARIAELATSPGLLIAIDGLNEAADPGALIEAVTGPCRTMDRGSIHVVVTSRPEAAEIAAARVEPTWLSGGTGWLELGPLDESDSQRLMGEIAFDELAPATRRMLRVPMLALLARQVGARDATRLTVDGLVESFVCSQTSDLERVVLRAIAARMIERGRQAMTRADYDDISTIAAALRECVTGEGPLGEAFTALADRGLLTTTGDADARDGVRVAFAHDRILQWMAGRRLALRSRTPDESAAAWGDLFRALSSAPALALAAGYALLQDEGGDQTIPALAGSARPEDRAVARAAIEVAAENVPARSVTLLRRAWQVSGRGGSARAELVALAADVGESDVLAEALGTRDVRDAATYALSRVASHSASTVSTALGQRWRALERRPWLRLPSTIRVLHALFHARFGEGWRRRDSVALDELAATIARRMVGTSTGRAARRLRGAMFGAAAVAVRGFAAVVPQGPTRHMLELLRMFRQPPSSRAWLRPLVEVFRGGRRVDDAADVIWRVASERNVAATIVLERALIAASRRPAETDAALDLAIEAGRLGCAAAPPTMMGQGGLYVLSCHLFRTPPASPGWDRRLRDFEDGLDGWLAEADERRWQSESGHTYKSLFIAAHAQLHHRRFGTRRTGRLDELWARVIATRDAGFAIDLLDDLQILAVSRGMCSLALDAAEPLLASSWQLPRPVHRECLEFLRAIHERAPDLVDDALRRGDEPVRATLARELRMGRATRTAGYAIFLDFDDALVLNDDLRDTIGRVFEGLLSIRRAAGFVDFVLRLVVNQVIGEPVFAELPA